MDERFVDEPVNALLVTFDKVGAAYLPLRSPGELEQATPSIVAIVEGDRIGFVMDVFG